MVAPPPCSRPPAYPRVVPSVCVLRLESPPCGAEVTDYAFSVSRKFTASIHQTEDPVYKEVKRMADLIDKKLVLCNGEHPNHKGRECGCGTVDGMVMRHNFTIAALCKRKDFPILRPVGGKHEPARVAVDALLTGASNIGKDLSRPQWETKLGAFAEGKADPVWVDGVQERGRIFGACLRPDEGATEAAAAAAMSGVNFGGSGGATPHPSWPPSPTRLSYHHLHHPLHLSSYA